VGRIKEKPAIHNGAICVRKLMWLSLTSIIVWWMAARGALPAIHQATVEEPYLLLA
jgi:hypothetical protein